jgi:hypothetical protein
MKLVTRYGKSQTWFRPLALLLIIAMLVGPGSAGLAAAATAPVMSAESKTAFVGDSFDVMIYIKDITDLSAFQFSLDYDPQIVSVQGVTLEPFLTSTGRTLGGQVGPTIDAVGGTVTYGAYTIGAAPAGPSAGATPVALAKVTMKALKAGFSSANLFGLTASNTAGTPQSPIGQGGLITIADQPAPTTIVAAPNLIVGVGGNFDVAITIANAVDLSAYQFTVAYDPSIIEFVSAKDGPFLTSTGRWFGGLVGPMTGAGTVTFGAYTNGLAPAGPSGNGTLAVLTFHAKAIGTSPLALSGTLVSDTAGVTRLAGATNGSVQVKQAVMRVDSTCSVERVAGEPFTIPVMIDYAADMSAFQFTLNWNPALFKLLDVQLGNFLLSTGRTFGGIVKSEGLGTLTYGAYTNGPTPAGPSGTGVLANLTFVPLAAGNGIFNLTMGSESNTRGDNFDVLFTDGCVRAVDAMPAVELTKTVGTVPGVCATTDYIELPDPVGGVVYYCYTIKNVGNITLPLHDLMDDQLGTIFTGLNYALAPGASVNTVAAGLSISANVTKTTENIGTWTGSNPQASAWLGKLIKVSATDKATVVVPEPTAVELSGFGVDGGATTVPLATVLIALLAAAALAGGTLVFARRRTF